MLLDVSGTAPGPFSDQQMLHTLFGDLKEQALLKQALILVAMLLPSCLLWRLLQSSYFTLSPFRAGLWLVVNKHLRRSLCFVQNNARFNKLKKIYTYYKYININIYILMTYTWLMRGLTLWDPHSNDHICAMLLLSGLICIYKCFYCCFASKYKPHHHKKMF